MLLNIDYLNSINIKELQLISVYGEGFFLESQGGSVCNGVGIAKHFGVKRYCVSVWRVISPENTVWRYYGQACRSEAHPASIS